MERTSVQKLAQVLRVLVIIVFICNILALFLVPMMVAGGLASFNGTINGLAGWASQDLSYLFGAKDDTSFYVPFGMVLYICWLAVWGDAYQAVLTVFLWACGGCTAAILWQGNRVLETILKGNPFVMDNAKSLKCAAICCFGISGAALARLIWAFTYYRSVNPLFTYNALFVPIFLMGGLLFLVMSALFRQAAELKAENDLTI